MKRFCIDFDIILGVCLDVFFNDFLVIFRGLFFDGYLKRFCIDFDIILFFFFGVCFWYFSHFVLLFFGSCFLIDF